MIRKLIGTTALCLGIVAVAGPVTPALAGGGPSDYALCVVTVDPATFAGGDVVTVVGTGLQPSFETTIEFHSVAVVVGTVTTDATGGFTTEITIPAGATAGAHTITAICDAAGNVSTTDVTVSSVSQPTTPGGGPLPRTGSDVEPLVVAGGVAVLAGLSFVLVAKRRRRTAS